jgi:hypothetical protein
MIEIGTTIRTVQKSGCKTSKNIIKNKSEIKGINQFLKSVISIFFLFKKYAR